MFIKMSKQSFFDKITGTIKAQPDISQGSDSPNASVNQPQASMPTKSLMMEPKIKIEEEFKVKPKEEQSWHNEVEGQLTVDVYQTPNEVVVKSTIAGVTIDDLDISITNDMVTVRGERKKDEDVLAQDYFHQECYWGPFSRSIILPMDVDSENASAAFKNGILTIRLPKAERVKTKKIRIAG